MLDSCLKLYAASDIAPFVQERPGETRVWQELGFVGSLQGLANGNQHYQYALLGIPEDIGPRANLGNPGAQHGWRAFLSRFLNLQANRFFSADNILLLGEVKVPTLGQLTPTTDELRQAVAELDTNVESAVQLLFDANITPIVIGGGHNNAFPIIKAAAQSLGQPLAVSNLDPHSDFRQMEGRHSGNPFRYAHDGNFLSHYAVVGLHEQKNNEASLAALAEYEFPYFSVQRSHWHKNDNFDQILEEAARYLMHSGLPTGVEVDLDAIQQMPSSAITAAGVSVDDALYYVTQMAQLPKSCYLHLAEGAPDPDKPEEIRSVGQVLAELTCTYIKNRP